MRLNLKTIQILEYFKREKIDRLFNEVEFILCFRNQLMDVVPKTVICYMVLQFCDDLHKDLMKILYSSDRSVAIFNHYQVHSNSYSNWGGGVQQQKRSCRREKPKMSFVFFVLFCSFSKHVQNRRFCAEFGQKCVLKKEQKRS